jgi:uncharacterized protein
VHPEAYPLVERILKQCGRPVDKVIGDSAFLKSLNAAQFTDERFGLPTVKDILAELDKPGRDPRPEFKTAEFKEGVEDIERPESRHVARRRGHQRHQLRRLRRHRRASGRPGAHLRLSNQYVKDPREVVKAGDVVKVKVLEVDVKRKRIALTMRLGDSAKGHAQQQAPGHVPASKRDKQSLQNANRNNTPSHNPNSAMAAAFSKLKK